LEWDGVAPGNLKAFNEEILILGDMDGDDLGNLKAFNEEILILGDMDGDDLGNLKAFNEEILILGDMDGANKSYVCQNDYITIYRDYLSMLFLCYQ
jgi:hypothetical protein